MKEQPEYEQKDVKGRIGRRKETTTRANIQNYIRATKPHSKVGFKFTTSLGKVQLQYLRSAIFGLGSVKCWVDDDVSRAVTVIAYWEETVNIGRYVFFPLPLPSFLHLPFFSLGRIYAPSSTIDVPRLA